MFTVQYSCTVSILCFFSWQVFRTIFQLFVAHVIPYYLAQKYTNSLSRTYLVISAFLVEEQHSCKIDASFKMTTYIHELDCVLAPLWTHTHLGRQWKAARKGCWLRRKWHFHFLFSTFHLTKARVVYGHLLSPFLRPLGERWRTIVCDASVSCMYSVR